MYKVFSGFLRTKIFHRVRPEDIAHYTMRRWFAEPVNLRRMKNSSFNRVKGYVLYECHPEYSVRATSHRVCRETAYS